MRDRSLDRLFLRFRDLSDGAALAALFDATAPGLFAVARRLVRDASEAEDLVQSTFLTAIRKASAYDGASPVQAWLYGILWREAAKTRRASARRLDPASLAARDEREPVDDLAAAEMPSAVERALERLPRRYREVLDPHVREGRGADEIAAALGRSAGTVRSQIRRGLERLRRGLPGGAAAFQGLAAIAPERLARMRLEVLGSAGVPVAGVAAGPWIAGGVFMSKSYLAAVVVLTTLLGTWIGYERGIVEGRSLATEQSDAAGYELARVDTGSRASGGSGAPLVEESAEPEREPRAASSISGAETTATSEDAVAYWLARFNEAPDDWRHGWGIAAEISALAPEESLRIMTAVWPSLSVPVKEQVLKPFVFDGGRPNALPILHLAATDASLPVQGRAFAYLQQSYAFQDFAADYAAYERWYETYKDQPLPRVLTANAERLVSDLLSSTPDELGKRVLEIGRIDLRTGKRNGVDLAAVMRGAGGTRVLEIGLESQDPEVRGKTLELASVLEPDETWLRTWILPAIDGSGDAPPDVVSRSFRVLGRKECAWAQEPILAYLKRTTELDVATAETPGAVVRPTAAKQAASALADIGDPASIPALIEILQQDRTGKLAYDIGHFGLAKLTGVRWQESYDAAWWADWWEKNRERMPSELRGESIGR